MVSNLSIESIKVLIIPEYSHFGGTLCFLHKLLDFHKKNKIESAIVIEERQCIPEVIDSFQDGGLQVYTIPNRSYIFRKPYFSLIYDIVCCWKFCQSFQADLIVVSTGTPSLMLGIFAFPKPLLFIVHTYPQRKFRLGMRLFIAWFSHFNNYFMTVSKFSATQIHKCMGVALDRIQVVYNSYQISKEFESTQIKKNVVLTVGHLTDYKNPELWLQVAQKVIEQMPEVQFIWLGYGELFAEITHQIKELGLDNKILLPGYCKDVGPYYSQSMVYFQPSLIESHGIAVVEAMAYGLPCLTSNVGGLPESVIHEETGYVCSPKDIDGFSSLLLELLNNPQLRAKMGKAGQARANLLFSEDVQESNFLNLYQHILNLNASDIR